jgi:hypothetical protein
MPLPKQKGWLAILFVFFLSGRAYPQRFSKETNGKAIRLGDVAYAVKSVTNYSLTLKILQAVGTY